MGEQATNQKSSATSVIRGDTSPGTVLQRGLICSVYRKTQRRLVCSMYRKAQRGLNCLRKEKSMGSTATAQLKTELTRVLGDLRKEAKTKLGKEKGKLPANHYSVSSHVGSLENVNDALTKGNKEKTSLGDRLQEVTNSLWGEEDQGN